MLGKEIKITLNGYDDPIKAIACGDEGNQEVFVTKDNLWPHMDGWGYNASFDGGVLVISVDDNVVAVEPVNVIVNKVSVQAYSMASTGFWVEVVE